MRMIQQQNDGGEIYDVVVVGGGLSGWMLLEAFSQYPAFSNLKVLMLHDGEEQLRSWCFWDDELPEPFCHMVHSSWSSLAFKSPRVATTQTLQERRYYYIPGEHFFQYFHRSFLAAHPHITSREARVIDIVQQSGLFDLRTSTGHFRARKVYNSALLGEKPVIGIWQHFRGWFIQTDKPSFQAGTAVLMDFNVPQHNGCSFMYVLPFSPTEALVELTYFSSHAFAPEVYDAVLEQYIAQQVGSNYRITLQEQGKIPMQQGVFHHTGPQGEVHIGTIAGMVKPSTGYAFQRIRNDSSLLAKQYFTGAPIRRQADRGRFAFYDALLLWIIAHHPERCANIFTALFHRRSMNLILRFMDQQTSLWEEMGIFLRLPKGIFLKACWHYFFTAKKRAAIRPVTPIPALQHA